VTLIYEFELDIQVNAFNILSQNRTHRHASFSHDDRDIAYELDLDIPRCPCTPKMYFLDQDFKS